MALTSLHLVWQWPAGRQPDHKLLLNIRDIKRERTGLFNFFKNVESAADYLPEAMVLLGTVAAGRVGLLGAEVSIRLPRIELGGVAAGDHVGVGIIDEDKGDRNICICIKSAPDGLGSKELKDWLQSMECSS